MTNTIDSDVKVSGDVRIGNVSNPPTVSGGSGAMSTTNKPDGSVHLRTDEVPEVLVGGAVQPIGLGQHAIECRVGDLTANQATTYTTYAPRKGKITGISRRFTLKPASVAGTVVTGITAGGNQVLQSASEDEEGITNDTLTAYTLTGTAAFLDVSKGEKIIITCTSDNADMTDGTDMMVYVYFEDK